MGAPSFMPAAVGIYKLFMFLWLHSVAQNGTIQVSIVIIAAEYGSKWRYHSLEIIRKDLWKYKYKRN